MLIVGVSGALRREELTFLQVQHIKDMGSYILIEIPNAKTNVRKEFTISNGDIENVDLLVIFRKYCSLRPSPIENSRFFFYRKKNMAPLPPPKKLSGAQNLKRKRQKQDETEKAAKSLAKFLKVKLPESSELVLHATEEDPFNKCSLNEVLGDKEQHTQEDLAIPGTSSAVKNITEENIPDIPSPLLLQAGK